MEPCSQISTDLSYALKSPCTFMVRLYAVLTENSSGLTSQGKEKQQHERRQTGTNLQTNKIAFYSAPGDECSAALTGIGMLQYHHGAAARATHQKLPHRTSLFLWCKVTRSPYHARASSRVSSSSPLCSMVLSPLYLQHKSRSCAMVTGIHEGDQAAN